MTYGHIQGDKRLAKIQFHFTKFIGDTAHLKVGDPVEYEVTHDMITGKPVACAVSKIAPEVVMSEERVIGTVTIETKTGPDGSETQGRISYENRGECFLTSFSMLDVEGNVTLASGDKVSFQVVTTVGHKKAKNIRRETFVQTRDGGCRYYLLISSVNNIITFF